jgi:hypothetical protein
LFYEFKNVEELKIYVKNEVLKEGVEASDLMINSLPNYLKIKIIINHIDRRKEVQLNQIVYGDANSIYDISMLFKPGHYD